MRHRSAGIEKGLPAPGELAEVGRVLRPHGVRGELVVEGWSEKEDRFAPGAGLLRADGSRLVVAATRSHHGRLLVRFEGIEDRDRADELRGAVLHVERKEVPPAPEGSYYHFDLVGCRVEDRSRGELGVVDGVVEDGGGALLRVVARGSGDARGSGRELLMPFVRAYLVRVDIAARRIEVDLPEGLLEACGSTS
jgi:16S rRNA processing protein RimM